MSQVPACSDFLFILIPESSSNPVCIFTSLHLVCFSSTLRCRSFVSSLSLILSLKQLVLYKNTSWNTCILNKMLFCRLYDNEFCQQPNVCTGPRCKVHFRHFCTPGTLMPQYVKSVYEVSSAVFCTAVNPEEK